MFRPLNVCVRNGYVVPLRPLVVERLIAAGIMDAQPGWKTTFGRNGLDT
jgi:hypothetical protein